jgi:hypothetical protein
MLATATMARLQRMHCLVTAPNITVIKFTMTAMVGKPPHQINMPRLDAYGPASKRAPTTGSIADLLLVV